MQIDMQAKPNMQIQLGVTSDLQHQSLRCKLCMQIHLAPNVQIQLAPLLTYTPVTQLQAVHADWHADWHAG